jgi:hypothetical protein
MHWLTLILSSILSMTRLFAVGDRERRYKNEAEKCLLSQWGSHTHGRNNVQFFDAYLSDLENLTLDLPQLIRDALTRRASDLLIQRFGIPFVEPM